MSKLRRAVSPSRFYHVYNRGIDQKMIFETPQSQYFFTKCIRESLAQQEVSIYAYCVMNNHFHFLIHGELEHISDFMQLLEGRYGYTYNNYHQRKGRVFQTGFKSIPVMDESYFWGLVRYIHLNPVKAGLQRQPEHYHFSSLCELLHYKPEQAIIASAAVELILKSYETVDCFLAFHRRDDIAIYDDIAEEVETQTAAVLKYVLNEIQKQFHLSDWEEIQNTLRYRDAIIHLMHYKYRFSVQRISTLMSVSRYYVTLSLKVPLPVDAVLWE